MNVFCNQPARIAFCITELDVGGAERCLVQLVRRLDRTRFDPMVYCLGPRPAGNPTSLADEIEQAGVRVHCLGGRGIRQFPITLFKLRSLLAAQRPQLVQSLLFHANVLGTVAARWAGVPHIVTGIRVAERQSNWHLTLARWTARWVERHICVSQDVREFSREHGGLPDLRLLVIPNGVDIERFATAKPASLASLAVRPGRHIITYVGRLEKQKGLPQLLERLPEALAQLPLHDLVVVGEGPERASCERIVQNANLGQRVHFLGYRCDVPDILAAADILVLPSMWEGMPNVVLEAMAAGKPVVANRVEGVKQLLGSAAEQQTVSLAADGMSAFINKMVEILNHSEVAARLGVENRRRVEQSFSLDSMTRAYEQLYDDLLAFRS